MMGIRLGANSYQPSPALVQHLAPALTSGSSVPDRIGGYDLVKGSGQSSDTTTGTYGIWGTSYRFRGYAHTDATRSPVYYAAALKSRYTDPSHSIIVFVRGEFTIPGSALVNWRVGGISTPGIRMRIGSSGTVQRYITTDVGAESAAFNSTAALAGTVSESVCLLIDGSARTSDMWVNGALSSASEAYQGGSVITAATGDQAFGDASGAIAQAIQEFQVYVLNSAPPSNIFDLCASLHYRPYMPLSAGEVAA